MVRHNLFNIESLITDVIMTDDSFESELENIRKRRMEEFRMSANAEWPDHPVKVSGSEYEGFIRKYPAVVIDFWATWCGPCQKLGPVLEELAAAHRGKLVIGKVNTDENQELAISQGIQGIPTMFVFKDGKRVGKPIVGFRSRQDLEKELKALLGL